MASHVRFTSVGVCATITLKINRVVGWCPGNDCHTHVVLTCQPCLTSLWVPLAGCTGYQGASGGDFTHTSWTYKSPVACHNCNRARATDVKRVFARLNTRPALAKEPGNAVSFAETWLALSNRAASGEWVRSSRNSSKYIKR
jgi:hypothetical protein